MKMELKTRNKKGELKSSGKLEIKNQSEKTADLFIYGDIVSDSWRKWQDEDTCPKDIMEFLGNLDGMEHLNVYINSGGGSVWAGIAIYQQLMRCEAKKTVHIDGIGASIASVIAMAADELVMPEGSMLMVHKPMNGYFSEMLNADELRKDAETLDRAQSCIMDIYMTMAADGVSRQKMEKAVNEETWMDAKTAQEYFKVSMAKEAAAAACGSAYFNRYRNLPEGLAKKGGDEKTAVNMEAITQAVAKTVDERMERMLEKEKLLADLGRFGA